MDRPRKVGHRDCWTAASLSIDPLRGVCLSRTIELDNVRLVMRDWPGVAGPLVHVPDPFHSSALADAVADLLAPRYRVISLLPRPATTYQVSAADLEAALEQFGFTNSVLIGERLGCVPALLVAAWYPRRVGGLVLADAAFEASGESVEARALRDCPPDWRGLRNAVHCPLAEANGVDEIEAFVVATLP